MGDRQIHHTEREFGYRVNLVGNGGKVKGEGEKGKEKREDEREKDIYREVRRRKSRSHPFRRGIGRESAGWRRHHPGKEGGEWVGLVS